MSRCYLGALILLTLTLLFGARPASAAESYDNCTGFITTLPTVISTQGTWCLKQDLATSLASGNAITISANNVTIDCNNFKLGGLAAGVGTQTIGIYATNRLNGTVRHCSIRGFLRGIYFSGSSGGGFAIEDNRFDNNTYVGIQVEGDGSVIRRNRVFDTGGTTHFTDANGIVSVYSVDILNNAISGVTATSGGGGGSFGIITSHNASGRIIGNGVQDLLKDGAGVIYGIFNTTSGRLIIRNNDLVGDASGGGVAVVCSSASASARDNVFSGFASSFSSCTDAGSNTAIP